MYSRSPASTAGCCDGSSRNQAHQASAQKKPIEPKTTKMVRQGRNPSRAVTTIGVSPPPRCAPAKKIPCAVPRSATGNQREKVFVTLGNAPASPAPKRKRMRSSEA